MCEHIAKPSRDCRTCPLLTPLLMEAETLQAALASVLLALTEDPVNEELLKVRRWAAAVLLRAPPQQVVRLP